MTSPYPVAFSKPLPFKAYLLYLVLLTITFFSKLFLLLNSRTLYSSDFSPLFTILGIYMLYLDAIYFYYMSEDASIDHTEIFFV